jgi:hypothetical protein
MPATDYAAGVTYIEDTVPVNPADLYLPALQR